MYNQWSAWDVKQVERDCQWDTKWLSFDTCVTCKAYFFFLVYRWVSKEIHGFVFFFVNINCFPCLTGLVHPCSKFDDEQIVNDKEEEDEIRLFWMGHIDFTMFHTNHYFKWNFNNCNWVAFQGATFDVISARVLSKKKFLTSICSSVFLLFAYFTFLFIQIYILNKAFGQLYATLKAKK